MGVYSALVCGRGEGEIRILSRNSMKNKEFWGKYFAYFKRIFFGERGGGPVGYQVEPRKDKDI